MKLSTAIVAASVLLLSSARGNAGSLAEGTDLDCNENSVPDSCEGQELRCDQAGEKDYVEYRTGTLPIILSAPHGGSMKPASIPERKSGSKARDMRTIELARAINAGLEYYTNGWRAHLVISHLDRSRLDLNHPMLEASEDNADAHQAWTEYHNAIDASHNAVTGAYGGGLYIDIHGLSGSRKLNEIGYLLKRGHYDVPKTRLNHPAYGSHTSMRSLAMTSGASLSDLLIGPDSIGSLLEKNGGLFERSYNVVPSQSHPTPGFDEKGKKIPYFNGGYSTRRHGSYYGDSIDGLQIEHVWAGVRNSSENREKYGKALALSLLTFMAKHTDFVAEHSVDPPVFGPPSDGPLACLEDADEELETAELELDPDLVGWWPLVPDSDSRVTDYTSNSDGFLFGTTAVQDGPSMDSEDWFGASHFNGNGDVFVADDVDFSDGTFSVAFSFRMDRDRERRYQFIYSHGTYSWRNSVSFFISPWGKLGANVRGADDRWSFWSVNPNVFVANGKWHDVVLTVDSNKPVAKIYLDGKLVKSASVAAGGVNPKSHIYVGSRSDLKSTRNFEGDIAEVKLFDRALSAEDVQKIGVR